MWSSDEFHGYEVESTLSSSDDRQIYRAVDQSDGSPVTLMVFRKDPDGSPCTEAAEREAAVRKQLRGVDGIESILFEGSTKAGVPYFVLPDRTGRTVEELMASRRMSVDEAVEMTMSVGATVIAANSHRVVLSTIEPGVVSLDKPLVLRDLSQARLMDARNDPLPISAAPEIARGEAPTRRTDVWALAAFLHRLLEPDASPTPGGPLASDPRIPELLADAITRALSIEPVDRHADVPAFLDAVSASRSERETAPPADMPGPPTVEVDDDPTVHVDEDLIRQIRVASIASGGSPPAPDDDPTVVVDEDLIRQIRAASATSESSAGLPEVDPTMVVDEDMVRQIRIAVESASTSQSVDEGVDETARADENLIREIRELSGTPVPPDSGIDDGTVLAGDGLLRQIRVGGAPEMSAPVSESPERASNDLSGDGLIGASAGTPASAQIPEAIPESPPPSIDDLRRRFSPQAQPSKVDHVPKWVLFAGIGLIGLLFVVILAVVIVG